jgi:hypothetical protein
MPNDTTPPSKPNDEFAVRTPDEGFQILLIELARRRGLQAFVPGRSRRQVVLKGTRAEVQTIVNEAAKLGLALEYRRLEVLAALLQQNGLQVPLKVATALAMAEIKLGMASGRLPPTKPATPPSAQASPEQKEVRP